MNEYPINWQKAWIPVKMPSEIYCKVYLVTQHGQISNPGEEAETSVRPVAVHHSLQVLFTLKIFVPSDPHRQAFPGLKHQYIWVNLVNIGICQGLHRARRK